MLKELPLIPLALVWSFLAHACNSTPSHSSETLPQIVATKPEQNSAPQASQQITGQSIWKGLSAQTEIEWTTDDLYSKSGQKVERIFQPMAKRGYDEFLADIGADKRKRGTDKCEYRRDFESSVGQSARQCNESIGKYVNLEEKAVRKVAAEYPAEPGFRVEGKVTVRIVVNKKGNVVSARAICGHPLLIAPSIKAALRWQFQPRLDGRPTNNIGYIVFIFEDTNQNERHS